MTIPNYEERLDLFRKSKKINRKNYKWRYTVIPSDWLAQMGFYFDPIEQENTGLVLKDAINCIYCHRHTFDLKHCRSKSKDKLETISNVLRQHLNGDNLNCPISYLRLKIIKDFKYNLGTSNWSNDPIFNDPFNLVTRNLFRTSFLELNSNQNWNKNEINDVINAGLIHFDLSFDAFNKNEYLLDVSSSQSASSTPYDIVFCIYCKNIIRLNFNDTLKPIERHFLACHNGHCYFFKKLIQSFPDFKDLKNLHEFNIIDETEPADSMDSIIHNSLLYENLTRDDTYDGINKEGNDIQVENNNSEKPMDTLEEPKSLDHPVNANVSHDQSENKDNASQKSSEEQDYESSVESQSIEDNDPTYEDDVDTEEEMETEAISNKVDKEHVTTTTSNNTKVDISGGRKQESQDKTKATSNPSNLNIKKRKKLLGKSPQRIVSTTDATSNDDISSEKSANASNDKELILNFTDHVNSRKGVTRNNKILDDSTDEFSFSNSGTHLFQISPLKTLENPLSKKILISNKELKQIVKTPETKKEESNNISAISTPVNPEKKGDSYDKNSSPDNTHVHATDNNIHSQIVPSTPREQEHHHVSLIHDENGQFTKPTNLEEEEQLLSKSMHDDKIIMTSTTNFNNNNNILETQNHDDGEQNNTTNQKENNLSINETPLKIDNQILSNNVSNDFGQHPKGDMSLNKIAIDHSDTPKRPREDSLDHLSLPIKKIKDSDASNLEDKQANGLKHDNNKIASRTLSGASMVTRIPNTIVGETNMKEKQTEVNTHHDFLTSSSSITDESDHNIPLHEKTITSSSLMLKDRESSYRRLRHA